MVPAHALALRPGIVRWNLVVRWNLGNVLSAGSVVLPLFLGAILLGGCAGATSQASRDASLKDNIDPSGRAVGGIHNDAYGDG